MKVSRLVRATPIIFYVAGAIILLIGLALPIFEFNRLGYSSKFQVDPETQRIVLADFVIRQASDALYMFANGLIVHVLIAIYDRLPPRSGEAAE